MDKYEGIVTDQSAQLISLEEENADLKRQVKYLQSEQAHQTEQSAVRIKNLQEIIKKHEHLTAVMNGTNNGAGSSKPSD